MLKRTVYGLVLCALTAVFAPAQSRQFLQAPQYSTGANSSPQAFAVADFNNDGIPDVAVADSATNAVSIFTGNGDGTFTAVNCSGTLTCATGSSPEGIVAADFNNDGNMDLAVTNCDSGTITILWGNGTGNFGSQLPLTLTAGSNPRGIAAADFNGDGYPDIVVTNSGSNNVGLFLNNGSGGFGAETTYNTGFNPWAIAVGDFNNDGIPDIVIADNNDNNIISVFLGQMGSGGFSFGQQFQYTVQQNGGITVEGYPVSVAVGDFYGDGNLHVAVAVQQAGQNLDNVTIMKGNGNGTFTEGMTYNTAPHPVTVTAANLNGDGYLDLAVVAGNGNIVTVFWGNGNGTFGGQVNAGTGDIPYAVAAADLTNNGTNDLIVTNSQGNSFSVIMNNGNNTFQSRLDYPAGPNAHSIVTADFNGDGIPDLAFADSNGSEISVELGNGDGTFQPPTAYSTGTATDPVFIVEGDFNQDGVPDVAVANNATGTVSVFLGQRLPNNGFTFGAPATYSVGQSGTTFAPEPTSIAVGDFNGDGYPDLAVTNYNQKSVSILLNVGKGPNAGTFAPAPNCDGSVNACAVGNEPVAVAAGNFYGNQTLDLVVINELDGTATILQGNGDGTFTAPQGPLAVGTNPVSVAVADLNGDGIPDLAVADELSLGTVSVLLGNGSGGFGNGTFQTAVAYPTGASPTAVVIGDFSGNGIPSLALTSASSGASLGNLVSLLPGVATSQGTASGTFGAPVLFGSGYLSNWLVVGDFNLDGALDVAAVNGGSNTVSILLNTQGTAINFTSSSSQPAYGQSLTLTATVAASVVSGLPAPTGTVTFMNGSTAIGTAQTLSGGQASISTSTLPAGTNALSAVYSGNSNYQPHTVNLSQVVSVATSSTSVSSSPNPAIPGQAVTFTASVTSPTAQPNGTVNFLNGSTVIGSGTLNAGQASFSTSSLAMGTQSITAVYAGNSNISGSTSSILQQVIGKANSTVALSSNPTAANLSQNVTFTATVSGTGGVPTGTVTFFDGSTQLGKSTLSGSATATFSTTSLPAGMDNITASYSGDNNFLPGTSSPLGLLVTAPDFTMHLGNFSPGTVSPGSPATATLTITAVGGLSPTAVKLACSVAPSASPAATCSVGSISASGASGTATLTFNSAGPQAASAIPDRQGSSGLFAFGLIIPAILLGGAGFSKPGRRKLMHLCLVLALAGCMAHMACGGGSGSSGSGGTGTTTGSSGTPAGLYTVTVTGTATGVQNPPQPLSTPVTVQ
jgi:hypothetical protein